MEGKGRFAVCGHPVMFEKRKIGSSKAGFGQGIRAFMFILKTTSKGRGMRKTSVKAEPNLNEPENALK